MTVYRLRLPTILAAATLTGASVSPVFADTAAEAPAEAPVAPAAQVASSDDIETVLIVGQRNDRKSTGATGLDLDIKDTPQSISTVTQEQMKQFGADSLNEALRLATGIQVDEWETNRTTFTARGFDIENTQIDGVGLPNDWGIVSGAIDTFGYDKIEVIRGANGLLTGVGNAAGTINYVRKRPTNDAQGQFDVSYGTWGTKRAEADYSTPFTSDSSWAGRVVAAHEDGDSYLRDKDDDRNFVYGVVDGQVGQNGTLTLGYSYQKNKTNGAMWGALTFMNNDGTQNEWNRNASTTQDWTSWDTTTQTGFVEYTHQLAQDWQLKLSYNYRNTGNDTHLFYAYLPTGSTGLDPDTGEGLVGYAWGGKDKMDAHLGTAAINGHFELFGREQELIAGVSAARSEYTGKGYDSADCGTDGCFAITMPGFPWTGDEVAEPTWGALSVESTLNQRLQRVYGATRISLTERLKAIVGVNYARYHRDGVSYGVVSDQTEGHTSPYGGLTFDITEHVLAYASYSDIYQPQSQVDASNHYLDATKGLNYEAGVKADWLNKRLLTTVAVFKAKQDKLATPNGLYNDYGQAIYIPVDVESKGVEFEVTGQLTDYAAIVVGYTTLKLTGDDGDDTYSWVPRHTANMMLSAHLPNYRALSFGVGGRWQSEISNVESSNQTVRQGDYTVLNAFAAWEFVPRATLQFNANNITDEKYISTLRYSGFYSAPVNYTVSLGWKF